MVAREPEIVPNLKRGPGKVVIVSISDGSAMPPAAREYYVALERPMLDPEVRPALVRMPDPVRFPAWVETKGKVLVVVPAETVADFIELDRPPLWCDFDAIWPEIARAAERHARDSCFDPDPDARTGLPRIVLLRQHLACGPDRATR